MEHLNYLNDTWALYFHSAQETNWTMSSYELLGQVSSVEEFVDMHQHLSQHLHKGIWFLTREHIHPSWDDSANIDGGCLSIKVLKPQASDYWFKLCSRMLGETLLRESHAHLWDHVNCVSISPKKHFVILKIWTRTDQIGTRELFDIGTDYGGEMFFKSNRELIIGNNTCRAPPPSAVPEKAMDTTT